MARQPEVMIQEAQNWFCLEVRRVLLNNAKCPIFGDDARRPIYAEGRVGDCEADKTSMPKRAYGLR